VKTFKKPNVLTGFIEKKRGHGKGGGPGPAVLGKMETAKKRLGETVRRIFMMEQALQKTEKKSLGMPRARRRGRRPAPASRKRISEHPNKLGSKETPKVLGKETVGEEGLVILRKHGRPSA